VQIKQQGLGFLLKETTGAVQQGSNLHLTVIKYKSDTLTYTAQFHLSLYLLIHAQLIFYASMI